MTTPLSNLDSKFVLIIPALFSYKKGNKIFMKFSSLYIPLTEQKLASTFQKYTPPPQKKEIHPTPLKLKKFAFIRATTFEMDERL